MGFIVLILSFAIVAVTIIILETISDYVEKKLEMQQNILDIGGVMGENGE